MYDLQRELSCYTSAPNGAALATVVYVCTGKVQAEIPIWPV
jgi:hypothetical protein